MVFRAASSDYDPNSMRDLVGGPGWHLDPQRVAVLVHDLIPYYVDTLGEQARSILLAEAQQIVTWAEGTGVPVITCGMLAPQTLAERGLAGRTWGLGPTVEEATEHSIRLPDQIFNVRKRAFSAFYATDLAVQLHRLQRDQLLIIGVYTSHGITATAFDAYANDIETLMPIQATADLNYALQRHALHALRRSTSQLITNEPFTQ